MVEPLVPWTTSKWATPRTVRTGSGAPNTNPITLNPNRGQMCAIVVFRGGQVGWGHMSGHRQRRPRGDATRDSLRWAATRRQSRNHRSSVRPAAAGGGADAGSLASKRYMTPSFVARRAAHIDELFTGATTFHPRRRRRALRSPRVTDRASDAKYGSGGGDSTIAARPPAPRRTTRQFMLIPFTHAP